MADRYWVGGTGSWSAVSTTNWSATSGGAGGASVPTAADNVFFDAASSGASYTVTITQNISTLNLNIAAPATGVVTLAGTVQVNINGSIDVVASTVWTHTGTLVITGAANPVTCAIRPTISSLISTSLAKTFNLTSDLTTTNNFNLNTTSFNLVLNGFNLNCATFNWVNGNLNIGATNLTATTGNLVVAAPVAGTFTATTGWLQMLDSLGTGVALQTSGTSTIALRIRVPSNSSNGAKVELNLGGAQTISTLQVESPTTTGQKRIGIRQNNKVINNLNLGTVGADPSRRIFCCTLIALTPYTITNSTSATLVNVDFRGIGLSVARSGTSLGGCGATANITFTAAKTVYWNLLAGGSWAQNAFATTSGGAPALANWPLPQDTVIFDNAGLNTGATITNNVAFFAMPGMNASTRSNAMTLTVGGGSQEVLMCGPVYIFSSAFTLTATATLLEFSNTVSNFTYLNSTNPAPGIFQGLGSNITLGANSFAFGINLLNGTFNLNNFNITLNNALFYFTTTTTRTLAFAATGSINITALTGTVISGASTNFSVTGTGARNVNLTGASTTGTRTITPGGGSGTNVYSINASAGSGAATLTFTSPPEWLNVNFTGYSGSLAAGYTFTVNGDVTFGATFNAINTATLIFQATSGTQTLTSSGKATANITKNNAGTLNFADAINCSNVTINAGTVNLNDFTHTVGNNWGFGNVSVSTAVTLNWGAVGSTLNLNGSGAEFRNIRSNQSLITWTGAGTKTIIFSSAVNSGTRQCAPGSNLTEALAPIINITGAPAAGTASFLFGAILETMHFKSITFPVGGNYVWNAVASSTLALYGNLTLTSTVTMSYAGVIDFRNTSGTALLTTAGRTFPGAIGRNGVGGTTQMVDALTTTSTTAFSVTAGTWNLNNFTVTAQLLASSGTATRSLAFGTGSINLTSTASVQVINIPSGGTGFTVTGTPTVNITGAAASGITRTITIVGTPEAASLNVNVTGGFSGAIVAIGGSVFRSLSFIGSNSIPSGTLAITMYGSLTIPTVGGGWSSTGTMTWANTSGTAVVTSSLNPMGCAMVMDGPGGTLQLADSLNLSTGAGVNTFTLTRGTLNLNNLPLSCRGFLSNNSNTRVLALGTGNVSIFQSASSPTTIWDTSTSTNLTITGTTCSININAQLTSTTLTFAGGGATFPGVVRFINFGASGTPPVFIISGNNTFSTLGSDNFGGSYLRTLSLTSGTTQTVTTFAYVGASGSLSTLNSTTAGSQATLSKASGTVTASYLSIQDSNATGGATWNAGNGTNTNAGNNTGWSFAAIVTFIASAFLNFF
jgi:hypothetical protein